MKQVEIVYKKGDYYRPLCVIAVSKELNDELTLEQVELHLLKNYPKIYLDGKWLWRELTEIDELMRNG